MAELSIGELIRRWIPGSVSYLNESPALCEDCGNATDLGHKCRACYARWKALLWQDLPSRHQEVIRIAKQLNALSETSRRLIADMALGKASGRLVHDLAEIFSHVKHAMEGPYGPALEAKFQAIRSSPSGDKASSRRGAREDAE